MKNNLKKEIEAYVSDWHYDEASEKYAYELGKFLFSFFNFLEDNQLSKRTIRTHRGNIQLIGSFELGYGYNDEFFPENLADGPNFLYEFERKVSDSKYAIQSYTSTWRKLDIFIKTGIYELYLREIEDEIEKKGG